MYALFLAALAGLAYLYADYAGFEDDLDDPVTKTLLIAMLLVASILAILFCTHFIIYKVTKAKQRKREKKIHNANDR